MNRKIKVAKLKYLHLRAHLDVFYSKTLTVAQMEGMLSEYYKKAEFDPPGVEVPAALTIGATEHSPIILILDANSDLSDIHHEIIHVTMFMFASIGEKHTCENDEFFAYTSSAIFEDILNLIEIKYKSKIPFPKLQK